MPVRHIVIFIIKPKVGKAGAKQIQNTLATLGSSPGLLEWRVVESQDRRKGDIVIENALFADMESLMAFTTSDAHYNAAKQISALADWYVADYKE